MAPIYREIVLSWRGEEVTVQPSYRMVQRIEASGISIVGVLESIRRGEPRLSQVGEIVSHMLQSGGAKNATPELVWTHLAAHMTDEEWIRIVEALSIAFIPQEKTQGNSAAPVDGADSESSKTEAAR